MSNFLLAIFLLVPLVFSGVIHMIIVKKNFFSFLKIPFHEKLFGANKTYRGLVVMIIATVVGIYLNDYLMKLTTNESMYTGYSLVLVGVLLGISYILFELPNSYIKRRIGIEPGKRAKRFALFFTIYDQVDSGFGLGLVYYFYLNINIVPIVYMLLIGTFVHLFFNVLLYLVGVRKEPF